MLFTSWLYCALKLEVIVSLSLGDPPRLYSNGHPSLYLIPFPRFLIQFFGWTQQLPLSKGSNLYLYPE